MTVSTKEACTLRVQFVNEETNTVVSKKTIEVEGNLLSATKEIRLDDVQTGPEGLLVQCDLIDGDGAKL